MNTITRQELQTRLSDPSLVLLEALPERYYREGHLPGARLFPVETARELARKVAAKQDTPIVVYCASETCQNSHQVAKLLGDVGYTNVSVYAGGKADWQEAGLPIER
jgi:rhodanese-related sulfurtransferase